MYADGASGGAGGGGAITVLSTVAGSPAQRAGITKGDVIEQVEETRVWGSADDAASLLRGEEGQVVRVRIRGGDKETVMARERITPRPVTWVNKDVSGKKVTSSSSHSCEIFCKPCKPCVNEVDTVDAEAATRLRFMDSQPSTLDPLNPQLLPGAPMH